MYQETMNSQFILGQGSMYERMRRAAQNLLDPFIFHAALVYSDAGRTVLGDAHREYLDIGQRFGLPMIATTPTWRANTDRVAQSDFADRNVNRDGAQFMLDLRDSYGPDAAPILIGGITGPKGDGYLPQQAPSAQQAERFHNPQIEALAESGVDFLIAKTLPSFDEARGIARAMARSELPYVLSFVVRPDGAILDGTPLADAIACIDRETDHPPDSYNVNCVHASVFAAAIKATNRQDPSTAARIGGLDANTSSKSPEELEGLEELDTEAAEDFGKNLWALHTDIGTKYLGGCCGSSTEHIAALASCSIGGARSSELVD